MQQVGRPFSDYGSDLVATIDGGPGRGMGIETAGLSEPMVTTILPGDASPQTDSVALEAPVDAIEALQFAVAEHGSTTALSMQEAYGGGGGTYNPLYVASELANPNGGSNLPSQGQTFFTDVSNGLTTGGVATVGGDNTAYEKGVMIYSSVTPALNGVYAVKAHIYYTPGFLTTGFFVTRGQGVSEDPFAE